MIRPKVSSKTSTVRILFLIDGVRVSQKTYLSRKVFGEYPGAYFQVVEIRPPQVRRER